MKELFQSSARVLLGLSIVGSVLAMGSLHTEVLCVVAIGLTLAAVLAWAGADPVLPRPAATVLVLTALALTAFTAIQAIPLPVAWVAKLSPQSADAWTRALTPLREGGPARVSISLDPIATRIELARGLVYVVAYLAALRVAARREGAGALSVVLVGSSLVVGVSAVMHPLLGADKVFGFYAPVGAIGERHVSSLLNANHLAAYVNIGFAIALAAALSPPSRMPRVVSATAAILLLGVEIWVGSRGGVAAMALGALLVLWLVREELRGEGPHKASWLVPGLLCAAGVVAVALAGDDVRLELVDSDASKLDLTRASFAAAAPFALVGMGRGSFESVFPAYRVGRGHVVFTHPENVIAQWACEWGVGVAVIALAAIAFALRPSGMRARAALALGPWVALVVTAIHNLVDFSSEVPGVMIALVACAAIVTGGTGGERKGPRMMRWARAPSLVAIAAGVLGVCAVAVGWSTLGKNLADDRRALQARANDTTTLKDVFHAEVREAMLRHPAEPYLPFAGGVRAAYARDESPVPWIARVLDRAPIYPPAHLVLARTFTVSSPAQARLEYRIAAEQSPALMGPAVLESVRLVRDFDDALQLVPQSPERADAMELVAVAVSTRLPATRARLDGLMLAERPTVPTLVRAAEDTLSDLRAGEAAPWCDGASLRHDCAKAGLASIDRARTMKPAAVNVLVLRANLLAASGEPKQALDGLATSCETADARITCWMRFVELARSSKDEARATNALERIGRAGCATDKECIEAFTFIAATEASRGNHALALSFYRMAAQKGPDRLDLLGEVATAAARAGLHAEALEAYRALTAKDPKNAEWPKAAAREQASIDHDRLIVP